MQKLQNKSGTKLNEMNSLSLSPHLLLANATTKKRGQRKHHTIKRIVSQSQLLSTWLLSLNLKSCHGPHLFCANSLCLLCHPCCSWCDSDPCAQSICLHFFFAPVPTGIHLHCCHSVSTHKSDDTHLTLFVVTVTPPLGETLSPLATLFPGLFPFSGVS